jgi:two-component system phosphate regulon response regulator PhoB
LIADDEPGLRQLVAVTLDSGAYSILEAEDGDQAWKLLCEHVPTVAVLDVAMPGKTGLELTRAIRAEPALRGMKVILLTGFSGDEDRAAGLSAGADHYLAKPFSPLQLVTLVESAISA